MAFLDSGTQTAATPEGLALRRKLGLDLLTQGASTEPVKAWTQGAARIAQALIGGYDVYAADQQQNAARDEATRNVVAALAGNQPKPAAVPSSPAAPAGTPAQNAVASIESGGNYNAVGPVIKSGPMMGDQAYGKYQVMGSNVGPWTQKFYGKELTPDEFLQNPQAQDAVFNGQFGQYVQKYGPEGAGRAWFAGPGNVNNPNATDQLGTTAGQYGSRVAAALAGQPASTPAPAAATGAAPTPQPAPTTPGQPAIDPRLIAALANPFTPQGVAALASAQATQQMAPPTFTQTGEDMLGNKEFGFVNPRTMTIYDKSGKPLTGAASSSTTIPTGSDGSPMKGQELMTYLEKNQPLAAAGVKGIIAGDINAGGRNLQKLLPLAELVDPTMKQFDYNTRMKTRTNYTSGSGANEIKAINTAIGHAAQLSDINPQLGGTNYFPGQANPVINAVKRASGDTNFQEAQRDWEAKSETLATEVSKALNGGTPHVADKEHWRSILMAASSPAERTAALKSVMGILQSRLEANAQSYNQGMGTTREGITFLNPDNVDRYNRMLATGSAAAPAKTPVGTSAAAPGLPAGWSVQVR